MSELAYRHLKEDIDSGKLAGGAVIKEADFVSRFDMSRTPVREALQRLIVEGYVEQIARGFVIVEMKKETVANIYRVRGQLEGMAARQAASVITRVDLAMLQDIHDQERILEASEATSARRAALSDAFHDALGKASQNLFLQSILDMARQRAAPYRARLLGTPGVRDMVMAEHQAIIDAIVSGDPAAAEFAARAHARHTMRFLLGRQITDQDLVLDRRVKDMIDRLDHRQTT